MIFKRRFSAALLVLLCSTFAATERGGDVKLDSDDLQVVYSDPPEAVASTPSRHLYTKEIAQCSPGESKMMLTLLLQSLKWSDVGERKQEKAIKKMSRFFLVPVKYIRHDDISTTEMLEMLKHSINKSNNLLNTKDAVGRIEFMIGCGDKLFASSKSVAHKVDDYVKLGMMEELSDLPIQWWNIWTKHVKSRLPRTRRQVEGSGNADEEDDYEEEYTDEQIEDDEDEDVNNNDDQSPTSAVNANQRKKQHSKGNKELSTAPKSQDDLPPPPQQRPTDGGAETEANEKIEDNVESENGVARGGEKIESESDYANPLEEESLAPIDGESDSVDDSIKGEQIEDITQRNAEANSPTPIGTNEIIKLEKEVDKTIENANNVDDVPLPPKQQDDKILEEFVNSMMPNVPVQELTTDSEVYTILTSPTTTVETPHTSRHQHHHRIHHRPDAPETATSGGEEPRPDTSLATAGAEDVTSEFFTTIATTTNTAVVQQQHVPEAETVFTPINKSRAHNEPINVFIDEKLPIVTATVDVTTATISTSEKESITMIEESVTDRMPSSASPSQPPLIISSTSHEHETTYNYPITTNPTIITTTAEITTIITEQSITEPTTTTTTLRNVDATVAHVVAEDKVSTAANDYEERKSIEESNYDDEYDDDDENFIDQPTQRPSSIATTARAPTTIKEDRRTPLPLIPTLPNEDEDDEDDEDNELDEDLLAQISTSTQAPTTQTPPPTTTIAATTTITTTTEQTTTVVSTTQSAATEITSESSEVTSDGSDYDDNEPPRVVKRIKKIQATAGKTFIYNLEGPIFEDKEGKTNLRLEMLDKNDEPLPSSSWIRFDAAKQEIYGLPLEKDVSRHEFKLRATDKDGAYVDEDVDVTVQQHKSFRSVNHEIFIKVSLEKQFESDVDWKIRLMRGINAVLGDNSLGNIYVRDVTPHKYEDTRYTFSYTNDSLPKEHCPKAELDDLMLKLTKQALNSEMRREIAVHNIEKELINSCAKVKTPRPPSLPPSRTNFPPTVRNHVDKIEAHVGQLLVFAVPEDTFYDPEDQNDLKLSLLYENRSLLESSNWLQFDAKNQEFYGVPTIYDKTQTYVLVAEDKNGLTTNDALVVEIQNPHSKRDFSVTFEYQLDIGYEQFKSAATKRKFIERIQQLFGDADASAILIKSVKELKHYGRTSVVVQNTTLTHRICPINLIDSLRTRLVRTDGNLRDEVKQAIGSEFNVLKISIVPTSKCSGGDTYHHPDETSPVDRPEEHESPLLNQEVLITYVLPTAIILLMLLIALLIACLLYKRRNTGKMELGDEEERKSFRSKGIPVIFQDELDEKPEIITKSPVILKDEKPPLLPQYNGLNQDGDEDVDQYIPPQPLLMGSRDSRGKSPVSQNTPSYRKPPPYVSP